MPSKIELFHGDCLDVMRDIPDGSIDMILCDLPYGTTACAWDTVIPFAPLWEQYKRIIRPNGAIVLFGSQPFTTELIHSNIKSFKFLWVWDKKFAGNFALSRYQPQKIHEDICVFSTGACRFFPQVVVRDKPIKHGANKCASESSAIAHAKDGYVGKIYDSKNPESIIRISNRSEKRGLHPTQKPVALCEYLIRTYTNEGETVLDNCMGSGTTGVACLRTMRNFIGIEKEEKYFKIASERIRKEQDDIEQSLYYRACDLQE